MSGGVRRVKMLQRAARSVSEALGSNSVMVRTARPVYEHALALLAGDRGMPWTINGSEFRISPAHRHRFGRTYDPTVAAFLAANVKPGSVCLDVGANVGVYALQFARWAGPAGRVLAFEPNPLAAAVLANHVRMNGMERQVEIVRAAVADASGVRTFHMADVDGMSRLGEPNPEIASRTREISVPVVTLDQYCEAHSITPDWLLIDVEGFEFAVLAGAQKTVLRATLNVVVEMHPNAWAVAGWTQTAGRRLLRDLGRCAVPLSGQADPYEIYGHVQLTVCAAN